ncbi:MAG: hypothetical protein H8D23_35815, partial [Candidatus Brocadiales bacterium]|nr:hypothetical protein [Candidatus Brocadiales bacterium]
YNEDLKHELRRYVRSNSELKRLRKKLPHVPTLNQDNVLISTMLANYYHDSTGSGLVHEGAMLSGFSWLFQYMRKIISPEMVEVILNKVFAGKTTHINIAGSGSASSLANEFSENLKRAPHLRGWIKMLLIGIFPFLIFFLLLGRWKYLVGWSMFYFSVCCWTPIWTLLHHINLKMLQTSQFIHGLDSFANGFSVYSAKLVLQKINYSYSVYMLLQTSLGIGFTIAFFAFVTMPLLKDKTPDSAPGELTDGAKGAAKMAVL